jgi:hypothetical protein
VSRRSQQDYGDTPKQKTQKGLELPLPKRKQVMDAFEKIAKAKPKKR